MMSGRNKLLIGLLIVLLLVVGGMLYFYLIKPLQAEIVHVQQLQAQEELFIEKIYEQLQENSKQVQQHTLELQRKVPVSPLIDQFLLHLEQAEKMTNVQIKAIKIDENTKAVKPIKSAGIDGEELTSPDGQSDGGEAEEGVSAEANQAEMAMPAELKRISFALEMVSPDYLSMENFLSAMEQLPRILTIDSLQFDPPPERDLGTQEEEIEYSLQVSIFYAEDLDELLDELPEEVFVKPANKQVPVVGKALN